MRLRQFLLAFVATLATVELVYLVYANLQLESAIHEVANAAELDVHYDSAYSKYPGDAQLRGLRLASRGQRSWSIYLERAELSLHPTLPLMHWSGILIVPSQMAHLELGNRMLSVQVRGDVRLRDLRAAEHGGSSDGCHLHLRSFDTASGPALGRTLTMDLIVDEARVARGASPFVRGEITGRGSDAELLWRALDPAHASGLAAFAGEAWSLQAQLRLEHRLLDVSGIYLQMDHAYARGRYLYDGRQRGRFLVVPRGGVQLGVELRDGALHPADPSGMHWLESVRSRSKVRSSGS